MTKRDDETKQWIAMIEGLVEPVGPPPHLRARLLETLEGPGRYEPLSGSLQRVFDLSREAVESLLLRAADPESWTMGIMPVRRYLDFRPGPAAVASRAGLVALAAGGSIPAHRHTEPEIMLVLEGRVVDDRGNDAAAGSFIESDVGSEHTVSVPRDGDAVVALLHGQIHLLGS